jgi:hypothetical protein
MRRTIDLTDPNWERTYRATTGYGGGDEGYTEDASMLKQSDIAERGRNIEQDIIQRELYGEQSLYATVQQVTTDPRSGLPIVLSEQIVRGGAEVIESPRPQPQYQQPYQQPYQQSYQQPYQQPHPPMNPMTNPAMYPPMNQPINPAINPAMNPAMNPAINPSLYPMYSTPLPQQQTPQQQMPQQMPQQMAPNPVPTPMNLPPNGNHLLREMGFDFLSFVPEPPPLLIKVRLSGPVRINIPFRCHKFVVTDQTVIVIVDKRQRESLEMDFGIDNPDIQMGLQLSDRLEIKVIPMIPRALEFDIGPLRCFLFFRKDEETEIQPETPAPAAVQQPVQQPATPYPHQPQYPQQQVQPFFNDSHLGTAFDPPNMIPPDPQQTPNAIDEESVISEWINEQSQ